MKMTVSAILEKHFPDQSIPPKEHFLLEPTWLLATRFLDVSAKQKKDEGLTAKERLDRMERLIEGLLYEIQCLPPQAGLDHTPKFLVMKLYNDFIGKPIDKIYNGVDGTLKYPSKVGYLEGARFNLDNAFVMHHNQRDHDFAEKVRLIDNARIWWRRCRQTEAPLKGDNLAYDDFVADLIVLCNKTWSVESAKNAYHNYHKGVVTSKITDLPHPD